MEDGVTTYNMAVMVCDEILVVGHSSFSREGAMEKLRNAAERYVGGEYNDSQGCPMMSCGEWILSESDESQGEDIS